MITYASTKRGFQQDALDGTLIPKLEQSVHAYLGHRVSPSEKSSWQSSLQYMNMVLSDSAIPDNSGVGIEYGLPLGTKRIDFLLTGSGAGDRDAVVIVELKQWTTAEAVDGVDGTVQTILGGGKRLTAHPSFQARSYAYTLRDYNEAADRPTLAIASCAYLHNYHPSDPEPLYSSQYAECLSESPAFLAPDASKLREFIRRYISAGDDARLLYEIEHGKIRPSKSLQDALAGMLAGNEEFILLDDQKVAFDIARKRALAAVANRTKEVVIVQGGPGTGKSVVAVNLLVDLLGNDLLTSYVSKNSAPRYVYKTKLARTTKRTRIDSLFRGSGQFVNSGADDFDALIVDESHRLNEKSGFYGNEGDHQIREIMRAARCAIFFVDDFQRVTLKDVGSTSLIEQMAQEVGATVTHLKLDSQFRCGGSDGYLDWVESMLDMAGTTPAGETEFDFDFRVFDSPHDLHAEIRKLNNGSNRSRMVAGYCWEWPTAGKNDPAQQEIEIEQHGYSASWNLGATQTWAIDPGSVEQVGCIHTCQGLEFDYVGVILGDDIRFENGAIVTDASKHPRQDAALKGLKKLPPSEAARIADEIIKNTYYVLMTRGMRGCYIYCTDQGLAEYFRTRLNGLDAMTGELLLAADEHPSWGDA